MSRAQSTTEEASTAAPSWQNFVVIEGTVKEAPVLRRNATATEQATFEICHERSRHARVHRSWFRIAVHGSLARKVVEGGPELGRGLIPGDRVLLRGRLGARAKRCGAKGCPLHHNHWWVNVDGGDEGSIELLARSLSETRVPYEQYQQQRRRARK